MKRIIFSLVLMQSGAVYSMNEQTPLLNCDQTQNCINNSDAIKYVIYIPNQNKAKVLEDIWDMGGIEGFKKLIEQVDKKKKRCCCWTIGKVNAQKTIENNEDVFDLWNEIKNNGRIIGLQSRQHIKGAFFSISGPENLKIKNDLIMWIKLAKYFDLKRAEEEIKKKDWASTRFLMKNNEAVIVSDLVGFYASSDEGLSDD